MKSQKPFTKREDSTRDYHRHDFGVEVFRAMVDLGGHQH
jgi:hypothetical protein